MDESTAERQARIRAALIDEGVAPDDADRTARDLAAGTPERAAVRDLFHPTTRTSRRAAGLLGDRTVLRISDPEGQAPA
jgi:hypothetical protein